MCFSAPASFAAAAVTGALGLASIAKADGPRELPLAAMPLLFSLQQAVEGLLWLMLPVAPSGGEASALTLVFLIYAKVFWPVYAPVAVALVETDGWRRALMWAIAAAGAMVGAYFLPQVLAESHPAAILGGHIVYEGPSGVPPWIMIGYFLATCIVLVASSSPSIRTLGALVTAGAAITYAFYWQAFTSVWCFFAAAASIVLYHHFAGTARTRGAARV